MTERIIGLANRLKTEYGTAEPRELCRCLSIAFLVADLPKRLNGFYMENENGRAVAVSSRLDRRAARSTAAHELGHAVLHQGLNTVFMSDTAVFVRGRYEREADLFAAALLIESDALAAGISVEELAKIHSLPIDAVEKFLTAIN